MFKELRQSLAVRAVLVVSIIIAVVAIGIVENYRYQQLRLDARNYSNSYANLIRNNVTQALSATYPLAAQVQMKRGDVSGFEELAEEMMAFYPGAASLQLAPDGVVKHIVPLEGNEKAIGHQLFKDPKREKEALLAKESDELTIAGPFLLKQGGIAAAGRLPIFIEDTVSSDRSFWGFSTVLIRFPEVLHTAELHALVEAGIAYELSRINPADNQKQVIARAGGLLASNPEKHDIKVANGVWTLAVTPIAGWTNPLFTGLEIILGFVFCFLMTFSAALIVRLKKHNDNLEHEVSRRTQALEYSTRVAQEANQAKSRFLSSMSHELRTPMNAVLGFTDILVNDNENPLSDDQLESVIYVRESGEHLLSLIDGVLDLSKIEAGHTDVVFQPVNCSEVLEQVIQLTHQQAENANIEIDQKFREQRPLTIWADQTKIKQVLLNFVSNAIKYNVPNGRVELICELAEDNRVCIGIKDTGKGVPQDQLEHMFESFNRLDQHNSSIEGTGIGLTISKKLVLAMEGEIGVYRNTDKGLTFWIEFAEWQEVKKRAAQ